jgi:sulfoquinovosidase
MWLQVPGDAEAAKQDQQWMLGPDVVVAPVVTKGATTRRVYLPAGSWVHGETGRTFSGAQYHDVAAPLTSLPHFVRAGTDPLGADRPGPTTTGAAGRTS